MIIRNDLVIMLFCLLVSVGPRAQSYPASAPVKKAFDIADLRKNLRCKRTARGRKTPLVWPLRRVTQMIYKSFEIDKWPPVLNSENPRRAGLRTPVGHVIRRALGKALVIGSRPRKGGPLQKRNIALTATLVFSCFISPELLSEKPSTPTAQEVWVAQTLRDMSLEEKVGQMLQIRAYGDYTSLSASDFFAVRAQIERYHVGSVDLGARMSGPNLLKGSPEQVLAVTNELQRVSKLPLLIGADIERGLASRLSGVPDFPFPMAFGAVADPDLVEKFAAITAVEARAVGIEWAFAPDADVNSNPLNPIINNRSFGDDPRMVGQLAVAYTRGAHRGRMMVALKHFPGEGDTTMDPHANITQIQADRQHLESNELIPFKEVLKARPDSVMLAQASVAAIDPNPRTVAATSAKVVNGLLRRELGFEGIVMTDALEMRGLTALYPGDTDPSGHIAVDAVKAGDDVLMLPRDLNAAYNSIIQAVRSGEISESRIDESVRRILRAKANLGLNEKRFVDPKLLNSVFADRQPFMLAQQISDAAITLVRDNGRVLPLGRHQSEGEISNPPDRARSIVVITFTDSSRSHLGKTFEDAIAAKDHEAKFFHFYNDRIGGESSTQSAIAAMAGANVVVIGAFITRLAPAQVSRGGVSVNAVGFAGLGTQYMGELLSVDPNKTIVVALGSPYLVETFPKIQTYVCTYSLTSTAELSAVRALFGEIHNNAKLPVSLLGVANRGTSVPWPTRALK